MPDFCTSEGALGFKVTQPAITATTPPGRRHPACAAAQPAEEQLLPEDRVQDHHHDDQHRPHRVAVQHGVSKVGGEYLADRAQAIVLAFQTGIFEAEVLSRSTDPTA